MTRQWKARLKRTLTMYFKSGMKAENPIPEKVLVIRQKTPTGASFIIIFVISIIISLNWPKKLATVSVLLPILANIIPTIRANKIVGNISPFAKAPIGFLGIIFKSVSARLVLSAIVTSAVSMLDVSRPIPGLIMFPTVRATVIATAVVTR